MAGAEDVVAAIEPRDGRGVLRPRLERAGPRAVEGDRARAGQRDARRHRVVLAAERERVGRRGGGAGRADPRRGGPSRDGDDQRRVRVPVRRTGRPRRRARARRALPRRGRGRPRGHDRCRDAEAGSSLDASGWRRSAARSAGTSTTRGTPVTRTRSPPSTPARPCSTRRWAGSAAAPSRPARRETSRPRTSSISSKATGWRRASTSMRSCACRVGSRGCSGRVLPGQVYRAG